MRYIGKNKNTKLRKQQTEIICYIITKLKTTNEIENFLKFLLTSSELAYISQRINIMQHILQDESYTDIKSDTGTTDGTINATKIQLKNTDKKMWKLVASGKPKPTKPENVVSGGGHSWIEPHYPGAIRL